MTSAPGEDSAYLSQGEGVISSIISAQSTDVDTVSGATFSSTGIINAVVDALGKAETDEKEAEKGPFDSGCHTACIFYLLSGTFFNGICRSKICFSGNCSTPADCLELIS